VSFPSTTQQSAVLSDRARYKQASPRKALSPLDMYASICAKYSEYPCATKRAEVLAPPPPSRSTPRSSARRAGRGKQCRARTARSESRSESRDLNVVAALSLRQVAPLAALILLEFSYNFCDFQSLALTNCELIEGWAGQVRLAYSHLGIEADDVFQIIWLRRS